MLTKTIGDDRERVEVSALCLGTMNFGTRTDEATAFAILDRFRESGGTFLDTANNYNQWLGQGDESEELVGRWLRSRRATEEMTVATKAGARSTVPGSVRTEHFEGLSAASVRKAVEGSLRRLQVDRIDLYYAHVDDRSVPLEESVGVFAELAETQTTRLIGCSNISAWRLAEAHRIADLHGRPRYTCVQQLHTYLWPRPGDGSVYTLTDDMADYVATRSDLTVTGYSPLFAGYYARRFQEPIVGDRRATWRRLVPEGTAWGHAANVRRLQVLDEVAEEVGATPSQVVLAWLLGSELPLIPVFGAGSVEQLDEVLGALRVELTQEQRERLNKAG